MGQSCNKTLQTSRDVSHEKKKKKNEKEKKKPSVFVVFKAHPSKNATSIMGCITQSFASRLREVILPSAQPW